MNENEKTQPTDSLPIVPQSKPKHTYRIVDKPCEECEDTGVVKCVVKKKKCKVTYERPCSQCKPEKYAKWSENLCVV